ncbi:hypothetical protein ACHAWF_013223 [Thalassiosira exigua]
MAAADATSTDAGASPPTDPGAADSAPPPPRTRPPPRRVVRRPPSDRNRALEVLAILALYVAVVHYVLKVASFLSADDDGDRVPPSREEMLGMRGAAGVLGFAPRVVPSAGASAGRRGSSIATRGGAFSNRDEVRTGASPLHPSFVATRRCGRSSSLRAVPLDAPSEVLRGGSIATPTNDDSNDSDGRNNDDDGDGNGSKIHKRPRIPVLAYRDDCAVVSKPAGTPMHANPNTHSRWGRPRSPDLQRAIRRQLGRKPYLVHRLDHRTSGAVVVAFDSETAAELHGRMRDDDATKLYVALVRGDLRERFREAAEAGDRGVDLSKGGDGNVVGMRGRAPKAHIEGEGEDGQPSWERFNEGERGGMITVTRPIKMDGTEKAARTDFYFLSSMEWPDEEADEDTENDDSERAKTKVPYTTKSLTLLLCRPRTGRTHQIRRHCQGGLDAPVIGDSKHGDSRVNRHWRTEVGLDRLGLHCWYLGLPPPDSTSDSGEAVGEHEQGAGDGDGDVDEDGGWIRCLAPLPPDFSQPLSHERLRPLWDEALASQPQLGAEPHDERGGTFGRRYRKKRTDDRSCSSSR